MLQTAVFVDAGYLFAAGSALIAGTRQPRTACQLDAAKALATIRIFAGQVENTARLLRIYWYDGIRPYSGPSAEQMALSQRDFVKLRLGMLNSQGQQKGVDSLIVTDLIDLARNKALSDALIIAGDEDLRVGVQVAQSFGVRVHLLSVAPTRGNVSPHLIQEVDSLIEMDAECVGSFLACKPAPQQGPVSNGKVPLAQPVAETVESINFATAIRSILTRFTQDQLRDFKRQLESTNLIPREVDAPIMAQLRHELRRDLTPQEKQTTRKATRSAIDGVE